MSKNNFKTIYLISCTKNKRNYRCKAEEMYTASNLFNTYFNYALSKVDDKDSQIFILSAKHHLLKLTDVIDPYDKTLKTMKKEEKESWGKTTYQELKENFDIDNTKFIVLAGSDYIKPLEKYLASLINPIPKEYRTLGRRMKWLKENTNNVVYAKELRNLNELKKIPKDMPGWYRWWADKSALKEILDSPYIGEKYFSTLLPYLTTKKIENKIYYYIYVGVAVRESIQARLNWHVNQKHSKSSVQSGFLSTLRQSLSSLVAGNQYNEEKTNAFIDKLVIEYYPVNEKIKSKNAKEKIEEIEKGEMSKNVLPLNIRDNKNGIVKDYLKELSRVRKKSKS